MDWPLDPAHQHGLKHAVLTDGRSQLFQLRSLEHPPGLIRVRADLLDPHVHDLVLAIPAQVAGQEEVETTTKTPLYHASPRQVGCARESVPADA